MIPMIKRWQMRVLIFFVSMFALIKAAEAQAVGEYNQGGLTLVLGDDKARITYMGERCIGDFTGYVTKYHDRITLSDPNAELSPECIFTLIVDQHESIIIDQGQGCTTYHGAECSLSGVVYLDNNIKPDDF